MSEPRAVAIRSGLRRAAPWLIAAVAIAAVLIARAVLVTPPLARLLPMPSAAEDPAGTRAWIGSLAVPRGGPYLIGFQSPGPARLAGVGGGGVGGAGGGGSGGAGGGGGVGGGAQSQPRAGGQARAGVQQGRWQLRDR